MNTVLPSLLLALALASCATEGPARLPDVPAPPPVGEGCDVVWFDAAFRVEVSGRLGVREREPGRLARMEIQDGELVERARVCLERVLDEAASPPSSRSGLAFGLLAQGGLSPGDWLQVLTGYRARKVAPCVGRSRGGSDGEARLRCGQKLDGQRPDLVVVHTCRVLAGAVKEMAPQFGREVAQGVIRIGLSGHALGDCLGILVDRMWESDAALSRVLTELGDRPNGGFLHGHFMRMGADLLPRFAQMARLEDRAAGQDPQRREAGCHATRLLWDLVQQETILLEGELEDIQIPEGASCLQEMGVLLPHAHPP